MHKPVLVTGASSGIGEATAVHLARQGFRVYAAARRLDKLKELEAVGAGRISALALDVTDPASIDAAMTVITDGGQPLFGLVNNAGASFTGPIEELPLEDWRAQYETNVFGVVAMTKAVLPMMREAGAGRIVTVGSLSGRIAPAFMGAYASSKHAVEGFSDALRREVSRFGLKVSVIRPGFINTNFGEAEQDGFERFIDDSSPYADALKVFKNWHAQGHPNGASPMVVAEAIHHALTADKPHARYTAPKTFIPSLMVRNLAPTRLTDFILARTTGLDKFR